MPLWGTSLMVGPKSTISASIRISRNVPRHVEGKHLLRGLDYGRAAVDGFHDPVVDPQDDGKGNRRGLVGRPVVQVDEHLVGPKGCRQRGPRDMLGGLG